MSKKREMGSSIVPHRSRELVNLERRLFLRQGLSVGALAMLAGCQLTDQESLQRVPITPRTRYARSMAGSTASSSAA